MTATAYKAGSNLEKILSEGNSRSPASAVAPRRRRQRDCRQGQILKASSMPSTSPTTRPPWCACAPWRRACRPSRNASRPSCR